MIYKYHWDACFKKNVLYWRLFGVTVAVSLVGGVATVVSFDGAADFFGRPRFLTEPSVFFVTFGFGTAFLMPPVPDGRPRFLAGETSFAGADGVTTTKTFLGVVPDGRPRFFFVSSLTFSFSSGTAIGVAWT